jgi:hypothetical protein
MNDDDMAVEYDLAAMPGAVRGKYFQAAEKAVRVIRLPSDLQDAYPDEQSIRQALREHLAAHQGIASGSDR